MSDGHLGPTGTSKQRIELTSNSVRPVHSETYGAGSTGGQFVANKSDKMLKGDVIKPATTECESAMVFAPKKVHSNSVPLIES